MVVVDGVEILTEDKEVLVAVAECIRSDRDAWREAALRLAEQYAQAAGITVCIGAFDLASIRLLLAELADSPVRRSPMQAGSRRLH
jgi:hypothetical protein